MESRESTHLTIDILFVTTSKDFNVLPASIKGALFSAENYAINEILVVVPQQEVDLCENAISDFPNARVVSESLLINPDLRNLMKKSFGPRYGWVLQQVLKLVCVSNSNSNGVLVVDSDTVLLMKRDWLALDGSQILLPTFELHQPYYEYLQHLKLINSTPDNSYVAHHMLMRPQIVREMMSNIFFDLDNLVEDLSNYKSNDPISPFSIDYELYANYLNKTHKSAIRLEKWSNLSLERSKCIKLDFESLYKDFNSDFASISLHSYL